MMQLQHQLHHIAVLANLTPATVAAIEDVPLKHRLLALPKVQEVREADWSARAFDTEVTRIGDGIDPDEPEMFCAKLLSGLAPDTNAWLIVTDRHVIYGGLDYDQCSRPMDDRDGEGSLFHSSDSDEREAYRRALGYTSDGEKDLALEAVGKRLGELVWEAVRKDRSLRQVVTRMIRRFGRDVSASMTVEKAIRYAAQFGADAEAYFAEAVSGLTNLSPLKDDDQKRLEPVVDLFRTLGETAWDQATLAGELSAPGTVQVRTARGDAVWVPDREAFSNIRHSAVHSLLSGKVRYVAEQHLELPICPVPNMTVLMLGSSTTRKRVVPAHYAISLDGENWYGKFSCEQLALDALLAASPEVTAAQVAAAIQEWATRYVKSVVEEFNAVTEGEVYGVTISVIDRLTCELLEAHELNYGGLIGTDYAEDELEGHLLETVIALTSASH